MDLKTLLKDLDGAVEKIHQIQANLTHFRVEELDVKLKNQLENLLCEWSLARDDQTMRVELGLGEPLDTMHHLLSSNLSNSSNSWKHLTKFEQEGSMSPRSTKQFHIEKKAHEQKNPIDEITAYVLFRPHSENPTLPHSHPSQPPSIRISKSKLWFFSSLFSDPLEQKQNGQLGDDDDNIVYDGTTTHQPRKYIDNLTIYTTGLIHSYYSSFFEGHDEFSALSDDRVWNAFTHGLRLVEEGYLDGGLLSKRERMDLNLRVEYASV
ncbi:uncharacterized protein EAE97_005577 [Botrytis byssoidea]|uniref:Uncharacterized protein n=1 Tax=Botrytis byssoidea TaxID=139641 RepID=A0A9P5IKS2_9HELO|nr:uncharacterized protein EAE97_005577 [Botrytis byssoidea]KAF7944944.1 hypothetical protein EAE97_005577 [Botrytis byssoidea]